MPRAKLKPIGSTVPQDVSRRLGIRVEQGQHIGRDGYWVTYGHSRGAEWFPTESKALDALESYVHRRLEGMAKEFVAFNKLHRWVVVRNFYLDGEEV